MKNLLISFLFFVTPLLAQAGNEIGGGGGMMAVNIGDTVIIQKADISDIRLKDHSIIPANEFVSKYRRHNKHHIKFDADSRVIDIQLKNGEIIDLKKNQTSSGDMGGGGKL